MQVSVALYRNMTAKKTKVKNRSIVKVSADPVMKLRIFSNSRTRHRITDPPTGEIGHWQRHKVIEQPASELHIDLVRGLAEHEGPQPAEEHLEDRDDRETDHQHVERRQASVHQHLIDNHLKSERGDQAEQLQKERGNQHFADDAAVAPDLGDEPAQIEHLRQTGNRGAATQQYESARPPRLEFGAFDDLCPPFSRQVDDHLVVHDAGDGGKAAVGILGDRRQRCPGQPLPSRRNETGFEPEPAGDPDEILRRGGGGAREPAACEPPCVRGNAEIAGDHAEAQQPGVDHLRLDPG